MVGQLQPLDQKFPIVDARGNPTLYFIKWAQQKQIDLESSITAAQALAILVDYLNTHRLQEGSGIQFTPSGNLSDSPVIAADVQEILDQITATRGAILYRGLLGWAALLPGVAGQVLSTNGAGADPSWLTVSSGSSYERPRAVPLAASFTLQNATSATITDSANNSGILFNSVNNTGSIRMIRRNGAPPATPYSIITRSQPIYGSSVGYPATIIVRNSVSGKIIIFGAYNLTQELVQQWSNYTTFNANILAPMTPWVQGVPVWRKVENDGVNLKFSISPDGVDFYELASTTLAAYIGSVDEIGMGAFVSGTIHKAKFQSWEVV